MRGARILSLEPRSAGHDADQTTALALTSRESGMSAQRGGLTSLRFRRDWKRIRTAMAPWYRYHRALPSCSDTIPLFSLRQPTFQTGIRACQRRYPHFRYLSARAAPRVSRAARADSLTT